MNGYVFVLSLEGPEVTEEALDRLADALVDMCEGTGLVLDHCTYGRKRGTYHLMWEELNRVAA